MSRLVLPGNLEITLARPGRWDAAKPQQQGDMGAGRATESGLATETRVRTGCETRNRESGQGATKLGGLNFY